MYIELHAASAFSFLQGASLPETLVDRAAALGYSALALLDADGVYGLPRFHKAARQAGLRPIVGAELTITLDSQLPIPHSQLPHSKSRITHRGSQCPNWSLPVLVQSRAGYQNLCRLVTRMKMRAAKGEGALALEELEGSTAGLVALAGRPLLDARQYGAEKLLDRLVGLFGRSGVCVELQRHLLRGEERDNAALDALAQAFRLPVVATNGVRFAEPSDRPVFDVLTCVRHHTTLDAAGRRLARNAERYLKSPAAMARLFSDRPDALAGTAALAERLEYTMADLGYRFPTYPVPPGETEMSFLRHLTDAGARDRYRPYHDKARAQIARELDLIEKLNLAGYFLIVWDIVNYCRQQDILVQGRGSAANSAVCYSLKITAVDPIAMDLLFERFLSEERGEWPDIDLDLPSGDRRERVVQHVYEKYGRLGAAMTANVVTYRSRSAAREVGKALSLDEGQIDTLAKVMNHFEFTDPNETLGRNLEMAGLSIDMPRMRTFARLWLAVQDLPRHLGQHSGGMVICQGALDSVVPLEPATMPGRVVIQWDKDDCADMGIVKVDLLGLGMMAVLQDAMGIVNGVGSGQWAVGSRQWAVGSGQWAVGSRQWAVGSENAEPSNPRCLLPTAYCPLDLAHLPTDDPAVYDLLQKADTIGVFQVESRAQMATLPRLKPKCFYDLVVEVAIIRPGPIVGQMVHPYLNRRSGKELETPLHPSLEPILKRTLGVPLFQEQLLRMAMVAAGFSGGQAEELRRAMGFKRSEKRMKQIETQLRDGMARNAITGETAERIITSITSFALYGFPESHAASFALLAYASAYLKVHHPEAFYTALLNNQPMGFYHPASLVKDAQRRGVRFHPIDVQRSEWLCTVEQDGGIRLGLMYVNGLRKEKGQAIAEAAPLDGFGGPVCAKCGSDDESMIDLVRETVSTPNAQLSSPNVQARTYFCNTCAHEWTVVHAPNGRFSSIDRLVQRIGLRRDELTTLADIGALSAFSRGRRDALWQIARAVRPSGDLYNEERSERFERSEPSEPSEPSPLPPMTKSDRLRADYGGMGLTLGPHPMALRRSEMAVHRVVPASKLPEVRHGRWVCVAGMVITRQRPGTAKGFVFLTLEDETGISNVIVRPDLFDRERLTLIRAPFLMIEGVLQNQEGVLSVRAEKVFAIDGGASVDAHDFY